mmetsp:Transcript_11565/g.13994  ORF Transcript_11565/g.13994 Transcript_11565/m.13994 type:complete len:225 (+) Transcript_11565:24-698(+)|eukprot:CAMPEP_0195328432 /NCGR_PEP_ID=MMETSP0708-20121125/10828_1 /TAXON_ID=33640 /ORGANISM="Asterionellopsis glacialis, Strain CCMP134" /LENGTH=224 /DNA_ID=CAMNT_0040396297 /DNA_START=9 /DNA_END=683 /DNA_ORIENTATION=+
MFISKKTACCLCAAIAIPSGHAFVAPSGCTASSVVESSGSSLQMGLFDGWKAGGSGRDSLDEEWEKQQEILRNRRAPKADRDAYFAKVEKRRKEASTKQKEMWAWQTKTYKKGEDPIDEWKKRRASGDISDLDNQYGDPKKIGGIPLPGASFGVGGEFGVGGKFDNGGRFDLRLPYADQGYVDEDADAMGNFMNMFGGGKKKSKAATDPVKEEPKKQNKWPWDK